MLLKRKKSHRGYGTLLGEVTPVRCVRVEQCEQDVGLSGIRKELAQFQLDVQEAPLVPVRFPLVARHVDLWCVNLI